MSITNRNRNHMDGCRGIINKIGYSYNDLKIVPAVISDIESRKECDIFEKDGFLPIFASPMLSVTNNKNFRLWKNNKIQAGGKKVEQGFEYSSGTNTQWLSVDEIKELLKTVGEH